MSTPPTRDALRDFPPVVYVPCDTPAGYEPGPDGQLHLEVHMRATRDGRVALLAYSALDRFYDCVGRETPWALLGHDGLDQLYATQPFDLLLLDIEIPEDNRKDGRWLTI